MCRILSIARVLTWDLQHLYMYILWLELYILWLNTYNYVIYTTYHCICDVVNVYT